MCTKKFEKHHFDNLLTLLRGMTNSDLNDLGSNVMKVIIQNDQSGIFDELK